EIFTKALEKNAGRPHTFKGCAKVESEVIEMIGNLLHLESPVGITTSGGTESNILAMLAARECAKKKTGTPEVIAPKTVHSSVDKAAWLLGIKLVKTRVDKEFKAVPDAIEKAISKQTIGIFSTAGTTYLGQIDPIDTIGKIAQDNKIPFHVDAAFGGFMIPFLNDLGLTNVQFDFSVEGVTSVSIDPHKMGQAPIPAGCIIFRNKHHLKSITRKIPYLPGASSTQAAILGTRPAASILSTWAIMKHLGREGYRAIVRDCMKRTKIAKGRVDVSPLLKVAINPVMNIIGIQSIERPNEQIVVDMEKKGWNLAISPLPPTIRLVIMPHVTFGTLNAFFNDLDDIASTIPSF
ncbi:MAG: tyrosine decarboxylase MfnA, partial [Candidatus Thorarchaeota archaeon]